MEDTKLPLTQHLEELRKRILICLAAVTVCFAVSYGFSDTLYHILARPVLSVMPDNGTFIFTGLTEAFFTYLKVSIFAGILLASPVILYQIWRFVAPGLYRDEKKYVFPFVLLSTIFFVGGVLFCFFVVYPIACKFFATYADRDILMHLRISEYLSFTCRILLAFGVVFELPIFILFLSKIGIVNHRQLAKNRKLVVVAVFIIAAFLTPPDIISQTLMALPLLVLYETSIIIARIFGTAPPEDVPEETTEE